MAKQPNDDLFQDTTMTFGEHLEELRVCLFRAVIGLVLATGFGLYYGDRVVEFISAPIIHALKDYYKLQAETDYAVWIEDEKRVGREPPYTLEEVKKIAQGDKELGIPELIFDVRYIHPATLTAPEPSNAPAKASEPEKQADAESKAESETKAETGSIDTLSKIAHLRDHLVPMLLWQPSDKDPRTSLNTLNVTEAFMIWLKASLVFGIVLSSPWVFFQIWTFVAAGLYPHERKYIYVFLPVSLGLFLLGAGTAYLFVFAPVLEFLFKFNRDMGFNPDPRISEWLSFVLLMPLGFGVSFQLPLVMLFIERIGIFTVQHYMSNWRVSILVIFIISAILTPADPYSIFLMAVPLTFLYFGGILLCKWLPKPQGPS